jgi:small subunit ribosomal protein S16
VGTYDPRKAGENFKIDVERVKHWMQKGAQPSNTVRSFLKKAERAATATKAA